MPELPEVETIRVQLETVLKGQRIKRVEVRREKSFQGSKKRVEGKKIVRVRRKAKMIIIDLWGEENLLIHLKMTGQLVYDLPGIRRVKSAKKIKSKRYSPLAAMSRDRIVGGHPTSDWVKKLPSKHTRVVMELDKGKLFFNDMRVFGWIKVVKDKELKRMLEKLPPDVIDREFSVKYLRQVLSSSSRAVKLILLDQKKMGGVGNIYANDGLFCAEIDPRKPGKELVKDEEKIRRLCKCLKQVMKKGIKYGGATASDYVDVQGLGGKYQEHFLVYDRGGEKCKRCRGKIKKVKLGGRGTYFCPNCQK